MPLTRRMLPAAVGVAAAHLLSPPGSFAVEKPVPDHVPGQVVVTFEERVDAAAARLAREAAGATLVHQFATIPSEVWAVAGDVPEAIERARADTRVMAAEPNCVIRVTSLRASVSRGGPNLPNDPQFVDQWGLHNTGQDGGTPDADIDAPEAWSVTTGGTVLLAVIDSGVDYLHPDLAPNMFTNPGETPGNGVDDDSNGFIDDVAGWDFVNDDNDPFDDNGHGTHCAGTASAVGNDSTGVCGVTWSSRILPVKFFDAGGSGSLADAIASIEYANLMGARVILAPWSGGGYSTAMNLAIAQVTGVFVTQAGNSGLDNDVFDTYPANYPQAHIVSVASTTRDDALSAFSNYGDNSVDLGAPGASIVSTTPGNSYATYSGTAMAASHVAGAACLLWSAAPALTREEVRLGILTRTDPKFDLAFTTITGGRLNVDGALAFAITAVEPTPPARTRALGRARPNPFVGATEIPLLLSADAEEVLLEVFDVTGRRVRTLSDGPRAKGRHVIRWDGRDASRRLVPAGAYYIRLRTPGLDEADQVLLVR